MWLSDAGEIIRNFHMWFKYGLKAQKFLEAVRPERAEAPSPGHRPGYNSSQQGALFYSN